MEMEGDENGDGRRWTIDNGVMELDELMDDRTMIEWLSEQMDDKMMTEWSNDDCDMTMVMRW